MNTTTNRMNPSTNGHAESGDTLAGLFTLVPLRHFGVNKPREIPAERFAEAAALIEKVKA
jgi:hypothetical protein